MGTPLVAGCLSLACGSGEGNDTLFGDDNTTATFSSSGSAAGTEAGSAEAATDSASEATTATATDTQASSETTTTGDGDGDATGDGDGDGDATTNPTTTSPTSGDGDGDGDGATTNPTTGDGDGDGDGDVGCKKVDLLFVIDDSGSMSDQQNKLTDAFPDFMALVDQALVVDKGIDYRVGVVSTDMAGSGHCILGGLICGQGHRGRLQHGPDRLNCSDTPVGRWIETGPVADVSAQFTCIASMDGGEFAEQPLEAMRAALFDRTADAEAYNANFIRTDALLVVVIVTDEDDQSVWEVGEGMGELFWPGLTSSPVSDYYDALVGLKGLAERVVIVGLHGDPNDDCPVGAEDPVVANAPRLHQLQSLAAPNAYWSDLCDEDFTAPLEAALTVIETSCANFPVPQ